MDSTKTADNGYRAKQQRVLAFIDSSRAIIESIQRDHASERFTLMYPRSRTNSEGGKSRSFSGSRGTRPAEFKLLAVPDELVSWEGELEDGSLSRLLGTKFSDCISYLGRLSARVSDRTSRILVTGDVNSGKSTFINSLLRQEILPTDQQPCTQSFCEIVSTMDRGFQSYVHATTDYTTYDPTDPKSFDLMLIDQMQEKIQDEQAPYQLFKVQLSAEDASFARSSSMDFSLIDSPGLNSDLFKTMALFSKQEDIDVIVFLVNAANHLTLSARQFLETASSEKSYIFVVVNKFDDIKNQQKCRRMILSQIQEVLPKTYEDRDELIHFVSTRMFNRHIRDCLGQSLTDIEFSEIEAARGESNHTDLVREFLKLEQDLRKFVMEKRTKSKLLPAKTYLIRVMGEVCHLLNFNKLQRQDDLSKLEHEISIIAPCFNSLMAHNGLIHADLRRSCEESCQTIYREATGQFGRFPVSAILRRIPWSGALNLYKFNQTAHTLISEEASKLIKSILVSSTLLTVDGIEHLDAIAVSHVKSIFKQGCAVDRKELIGAFTKLEESIVFPKPISIWNLFELAAIMKGSTWLSAATLAGAIFGYQPLLLLASRFLELSSGTGRLFTITVMAAASGLAIFSLLGDFETLIRDRLNVLYGDFFSSTIWTHEPARRLEAVAREVIIDRQRSLALQFDNALHQQRQLQATKDLQRIQTLTSLKFLEERLCQSKSLLNCIQEYQV